MNDLQLLTGGKAFALVPGVHGYFAIAISLIGARWNGVAPEAQGCGRRGK
jgi:hypothetical protein